LKAKEVKNILKGFINNYPWIKDSLDLRSRVEYSRIGDSRLIYVNGDPLILEVGDLRIPTLLFKEVLDGLPGIIVDMGAVSHICNGADVMAPGVRGVVDSFREESIVRVLDERHRKILSVGMSLTSSSSISSVKRGKIVNNLHYVGDDIWQILQIIKS